MADTTEMGLLHLAHRCHFRHNATMANSTSLTVSKENNVTVITAMSCSHTLNASGIPNIDDVLQIVQNAEPPIVVVDLSYTPLIASSFFAFLSQTWRRLNARDEWRLAVTGLTPAAMYAFETTRFNQLFEIFDTKEEAVQAMSADAE